MTECLSSFARDVSSFCKANEENLEPVEGVIVMWKSGCGAAFKLKDRKDGSLHTIQFTLQAGGDAFDGLKAIAQRDLDNERSH